MRKVIMLVILALALCLIPLAANADSGIKITDWDGDGWWNHNTWYVELYPGEEASMELELESSEDIVVYIEYDMPRDLFIWFDPAALEIEKDNTEWVEITVCAPGDTEPGEYRIDFTFEAIPIEAETEIIYRDRHLPGPEVIKYVDRTEYVDREIPVTKYIFIQKGIDWWWIPIGIISAILFTLLISEAIRKKQ